MASRKQNDDAPVEEEDTGVDEQEMEADGNGGGPALSIQVEQDVMVIELPRDGNEAETLQRLAQFADGF